MRWSQKDAVKSGEELPLKQKPSDFLGSPS
jgi:hypothetical protein